MEALQAVENGAALKDADSASGKTSAPRTRRSWVTGIVDGALLIIVITGAWYAWPVQREAGRLHTKRLELQRRVGEMPISDPTKYHVLLLKSDNPLEFRWRIYVPKGVGTTLATESKHSNGSSSGMSSFTHSSEPAGESLVTATILPKDESGNMQVKIRTTNLHTRGTGTQYLRDETIQRMASEKDISTWQIAGRNGVEVRSLDDLVSLLAIEGPEDDDTKRVSVLKIRLATQEALNKSQNP